MRALDPFVDPQVQAAVLAGLFLAAGWVLNGREQRRVAQALRDERVRDELRALYSEIRAYVSQLRDDDIGAYGATIRDRILTEPGFFPVIPTERNDTMFRVVVGEIQILPDATIHSVVLYYSQLVAIEAMIGDLRGLDPARIAPPRVAAMYGDYLLMKIDAAQLGAAALRDIVKEIDFALPPEAEGMAAWAASQKAAVNSRGGGPSVP
jgi:hypothetical protein